MKILVVLFFWAFAIISAVPLHSNSNDLDVEIDNDQDEYILTQALAADGGRSLEDVKKQLKERFEELFHKIKDAVEQGKGLREDSLEGLKKLREKLQNLNVDFGNRAKEAFERIREKGKEYLKKVLKRLGLDHKKVHEHAEGILLADDDDFDIGKLKEKFNELVKKMKDAFEQGKSTKDGLDKLQEFREKLKYLNIDLGEKGREYLELLKEKVKEYWKKLKEKLGSKRSADIDVFGMLEHLKEMIREKFDSNKLKEYVEKIFGKGNELTDQFFKLLKEKGEKHKQKILDWVDRVLGERESKGPVYEIYELIREYFRDLNIELKERFVKFGEWVKNQYEKGMERGKTKAQNVRNIAKEFLKDTREISKDMAQEALDFFRGYKEDLGSIYHDLVDKVHEVLKREGDVTQRPISEVYEKVKDYFRNLNIELKEKFVKFGEWVKNQYEKELERGKTRAENVRNIAKEFLKDTREISKDMAQKALDFFRDYKEDLGSIYHDLVDKVHEVFKKDENATQRPISEVYEKAKDYFRNLNIELKERFVKFGEWLKNQYEKELKQGKTRAENIRNIAKEFLRDTREISKDMAQKALDFFREYKEDLGSIYHDLVDKVREVFKKDENVTQRPISEVYEKVKDYFRNLNIELKERFVKFGEWVKNQYEKELEQGKTRAENVRNIAKEFLNDTRNIGKNMAHEALDFFREYKMVLGEVYDDLVDKIRDILKS